MNARRQRVLAGAIFGAVLCVVFCAGMNATNAQQAAQMSPEQALAQLSTIQPTYTGTVPQIQREVDLNALAFRTLAAVVEQYQQYQTLLRPVVKTKTKRGN